VRHLRLERQEANDVAELLQKEAANGEQGDQQRNYDSLYNIGVEKQAVI
jgi:hypothetical protein